MRTGWIFLTVSRLREVYRSYWAAVQGNDRDAVFPVRLAVGPADVEATLLNLTGRPLCGAFYVTIAETELSP